MKQVKLIRNASSSKQTTGKIYCGDGSMSFDYDTLELPWRDNQHDISCIPVGKYTCKWTRSNRLSALKGVDFFTYEVMNVPDRTGIRIHSSNYFFDLLGCIALGDGFVDMNGDGELDLLHSRDSINQFNGLMNKEDFELEIVNGQNTI